MKSNKIGSYKEGAQVRHRPFTDWVEANSIDFELIQKISNIYPITNRELPESFCDFYIYNKKLNSNTTTEDEKNACHDYQTKP